MSLFNTNITKLIKDNLPPLKRDSNLIAMCLGLFSKQENNNLNLLETIEGTTSTAYISGTYNRFDRVIYEREVYESLIDNNTDLPTITTSWIKVINNFLGLRETQNYTTSFIHLEYALNRYFDNISNTPYTLGSGNIYLSLNVLPPFSFLVGYTDANSSVVGYASSSEFITYDESMNIGTPLLVINVLNTISTALGSEFEKIISNFATKYIAEGITLKIVIY